MPPLLLRPCLAAFKAIFRSFSVDLRGSVVNYGVPDANSVASPAIAGCSRGHPTGRENSFGLLPPQAR